LGTMRPEPPDLGNLVPVFWNVQERLENPSDGTARAEPARIVAKCRGFPTNYGTAFSRRRYS